MKILIMGLPGSGKTTLASSLVPMLKAVHWNADEVRGNINKDLGFSMEDRIEQARRMGWLCDRVSKAGHVAVADFICPTATTREAFSPDYVVFMDTIDQGRYSDTNSIFEKPPLDSCDQIISTFNADTHALNIYQDILRKMEEWKTRTQRL